MIISIINLTSGKIKDEEVLELIGDTQVNLLVQGPHPADPTRVVFHWFEMCDAVQDGYAEGRRQTQAIE